MVSQPTFDFARDAVSIGKLKKSLLEFNVEALYAMCKAVDLDWVAALPDAKDSCL